MLELEHVSFRYNKNLPEVLTDVTMAFQPGEFVGITGRNGSGKTTITRLLTGLEKPTHGDVMYDGTDVTKEDASERSRFIGYVFQQPDRQMFMPTVREEVAFGPRQRGIKGTELDSLVNDAMEAVDITDIATAYPRTLSRGEQQRVAIASALAMKTRFLILDEPTSGQDGKEKRRLTRLMTKLRDAGICIILVTHDMDIVARDCSRVIVIADHHVAFDGTPPELFGDDKPLHEWGLAYPAAVLLGRKLPGSPYCKDMKEFCKMYIAAKEGA